MHGADTDVDLGEPIARVALADSAAVGAEDSDDSGHDASARLRLTVESELTMSRVDRRRAKKKRKAVLNNQSANLSDYIDVYGSGARGDIDFKLAEYFQHGRVGLRARDLQALIQWVMAEEICPKWVFVKNKPLVGRMVVLVCDGLTKHQYIQYKRHFAGVNAFYSKKKENPIPLHIKGSLFSNVSVVQDLITVPKKKEKSNSAYSTSATHTHTSTSSSSKEKKQRTEEKHDGHGVGGKPPASRYILTPAQLKENSYPIDAEAGFLHSCDHHRMKRKQMKAKIHHHRQHNPAYHCIHTRPFSSAQSSTVTVKVTPGLELEKLAESIDEDDESEDSDTDHHTHTANTVQPTSSSSHLPAQSDQPTLLALDCEMCYTCEGLELTRITLIDSTYAVLLDTLIKPTNAITSYNTKYSGITPGMMRDVTTTLEQVRSVLLTKHIHSSTILVGQSLENDLRALKIVHTNIIDTSLLFPHPRGPPHKSSLKYLVKKHLNRDIQCSDAGHDSTEDAHAAMELTLLKISKGPEFGEPLMDNEDLSAVLDRYKRSQCWVSSAAINKRFAPPMSPSSSVINVDSDEQCREQTVAVVKAGNHQFVFAHFQSLLKVIDECDGSNSDTGENPAIAAQCQALDAQLSAVLNACHASTLTMLVSGQSSAARMRRLQAVQVAKSQASDASQFVNEDASLSASLDQLHMSEAAVELSSGIVFVAVKQ